jgi:hypothetical protein
LKVSFELVVGVERMGKGNLPLGDLFDARVRIWIEASRF